MTVKAGIQQGGLEVQSSAGVSTFSVSDAGAVAAATNTSQHTFGSTDGAAATTILNVKTKSGSNAVMSVATNSAVFNITAVAGTDISLDDSGTLYKYAKITPAGAWTLGPASGAAVHTFQGGTTANTVQVKATAGGTPGITWHDGTAERATINSDSTNAFYFKTGVSGTQIGIVSQSGSWTLGPANANNVQHAHNGWISDYRKTSTSTDVIIYLSSDVGGTDVLKWRVEADGDTISATGSYTSDERAKKNLAPIQYGLAEIMRLSPKSFNWWHEEDSDTKSFCISTAQEVQAVMPEMVRDDGLDGPNGEKMKAIYDKEVVAVMVKAIQEQQAMIEELKAEVAALKAK